MSVYNVIAAGGESTVVAEYEPETRVASSYQSEAELEEHFISMLCAQGYERIRPRGEAELEANLRRQLERLNGYSFTDSEWRGFFSGSIANRNDGVTEKTRKIQSDYVQVLKRDGGETKNICLIDKKNIHNNSLQVMNQYSEEGGRHAVRYDVTVLVNGLPLVHIELKRRGVALREAFNQIRRYQRDSFWASGGLYEYVQIFVISNGTHTKYYSNTTREGHLRKVAESRGGGAGDSFEFTSFWADARNRPITDLVDFTKTFFARHTLLGVLARYCVFTAANELLVMRPYQIAATERILNRIETSHNYKREGTADAGGYIWHTTGSGKTLTSFKTAQLAAGLPYVDKVLFVVDRKDLDYQTMKEYDRFEKGAANGNTSTAVLKRQLSDPDARIIITTIQKLDVFIKKNRGHEAFGQNFVIIFDECHRSQFGDMHTAITRTFKKYHIFGFTGTPIFSANASAGGRTALKTTAQAFGDLLHAYTIVDAINDCNVLPFRIDYVNTIKGREDSQDKQVPSIDTEEALCAPERVSNIVAYVLDHFGQKTKRGGGSYEFSVLKDVRKSVSAMKRGGDADERTSVRLTGFNSIFAAASIDMAKRYYLEFKRQMAEAPEKKLKIATIFSFAANEEAGGILGEENSESTADMDKASRDFLDAAIRDYNAEFKTNYDTSSDKFQSYYKDVSLRMKDRGIDLLIVVNMFLTGFDAKALNTLWVDKYLKMHGLLQAFSRTNRILNSVKTYGNIVCFRNLEKATNDAIGLFGDRDAAGVVLLKNYEAYYYGYDEEGRHYPGYAELIDRMSAEFPLGGPICGEQRQKDFITLFGALLKLKNILTAFDAFAGNEILPPRDFQDYQSVYIDLYQQWQPKRGDDKESIKDDVVFEMELIRQVDVDIDYILALVAKYHASNCMDREVIVDIEKAVDSSLQLRSKKELIENFIRTVNAATNVEADWRSYVRGRRDGDLAELIGSERLKPEETKNFVDNAFRSGALKTTGTDIDLIMPPVSRFGGGRAAKKEGVIRKLMDFFEKYAGLV